MSSFYCRRSLVLFVLASGMIFGAPLVSVAQEAAAPAPVATSAPAASALLPSITDSLPAASQGLPSVPAAQNPTPVITEAPAVNPPSAQALAPAISAAAMPATSRTPVLPPMASPTTPALPGELTSDDLKVPDFGQNDALGLSEQTDFSYEKSKQELMEEARRQAFDSALQALLPLRPGEIRELLEKFDRTQESVEVPVYPPAKPQMVVQNISLDPGAAPAVIKLAYGNVTTLSILDASGAPWPIEDISWAGDFEITETSAGEGAHMVRISPRSEYATGNMSMRLLTLKTPVIFMMESNRDIVHYRFDAIIPDYGPMAKAPLINTGVSIQAGDQTISSFLQGVIPATAVRLGVSGIDGRTSAYRYGGMTYVRTPLTLLSPSWTNSVASADGMRIYTIQDSPVLLLSDKGKMVRAHLSDREDIFE